MKLFESSFSTLARLEEGRELARPLRFREESISYQEKVNRSRATKRKKILMLSARDSIQKESIRYTNNIVVVK